MKAAKKPEVWKAQMHYEVAYHFPCPIYLMERPDFLDVVNAVSEEYLDLARGKRELDEIYPVLMTENYFANAGQYGFLHGNVVTRASQALSNGSTRSRVRFTDYWVLLP